MTKKQLASLADVRTSKWERFMEELNNFAGCHDLQEYDTYHRIWEYPWVWFQLESLKERGLRVLDIGSERSPLPWFLATQGFKVIVSDITANSWRSWQRAGRELKVAVDKYILNAQNLALPTSYVDIYMSISVIEHMPNKEKAITEAARVLRPGGLLIMTFDICEPEMDMSFPEWSGQALTMQEFDELFRNSPWFEDELVELPWDTANILEYLTWHRTTAPHHNYVVGAAVVRRNDQVWGEPVWKEYWRPLRRKVHPVFAIVIWYLRYNIASKIVRLIRRLNPMFRNRQLN